VPAEREPPSFSGFLNSFRNLRQRAALRAPDHPGYYEGILVSGSRVLASGAMFAGLALALGGGHLAIATLAALPALTRLAHLAVPELVRRHGSWAVAASACWLERVGFLVAALFGILRPDGWAVPGFLAGIGLGFLGQNLYDASLAALHPEATPPATFGRYTATKARWAAISGLVLGVLASVAVAPDGTTNTYTVAAGVPVLTVSGNGGDPFGEGALLVIGATSEQAEDLARAAVTSRLSFTID
jgi:hypothetical protein